MNRLTDVVKHLLIINVIMFICFHFVFREFREYTFLFFPGTEHFKPYQLVSHMFMHGSESHILFNMMSLFFLGPMVEQNLGSKRFLIFYLLSGFAAMVLHLGLGYLGYISPSPIVGASGAIMGVFIAFALLYPDVKLMLIFPPIPVKAKYLMGVLVLVDLFSGVSGYSTGIAHFAHLGGAIMGFVLITIWGKNTLMSR